jgi:hypothetical protein
MNVEIRSEFHQTSATVRPRRTTDGRLVVSARAMREAVAKCCPSRGQHGQGGCACPITGPVIGPNTNGDWEVDQ